MKKIALLTSVMLLSSCIYAGPIDILPQRNSFFTRMNSYSVDLYDTEPKLVKSEYIDEKNFKLNVIMTAYKGYSVVNNKTYRKDIYASDYLKPLDTVTMSSASIPVRFNAGEKLKVIGDTWIDGKEYLLIPGRLTNYVAFIDAQGELWDRMGYLEDGRVVLIDSSFEPNPSGVKFVPVKSTKTEQTKPTKGFDVKYDGVKLDRIWFTFLDYNSSMGEKGVFENISFPNKPGLIEINGIKFRVLAADNDKIDYIILK